MTIRCGITALALAPAFLTTTLTAQRPAAPRTRDSAGVRIVENATIKTTHIAFDIDPKPTLSLGGLPNDPREEFDARNPYTTVLRLSDGRIVATDYTSFKMLDARGRFIRVVGRAGSGPGEFSHLRAACLLRGDTIVAFNFRDGRVSVFDSAGKHVRSFAVANVYAAERPCFTDGIVMITGSRTNPKTTMSAERAPKLDRVSAAIRVGTDGRVGDTLGVFAAESFQYVMPLYANFVAQGDAFYVGNGRTHEVFVHNSAGKVTRIIRWLNPQIPVTDAVVEGLTAFMYRRDATPEQRKQERARQIATSPLPEFVPAYTRMLADAAGRVWVQDYNLLKGATRGWTVFGPDGALLGRVEEPRVAAANGGRAEVGSIGRDYIVLKWHDSTDGALHITFHPLRPRG